MATYRVTAPDGGTYRIEGPDDATDSQVAQAVLAKFPDSNKPPAPPDESKSGFIPALQAGFKGLKSDAAALAAKTGLMDVGAAEEYIAKQREESAKIFQPTQDEWTESPWKKLKELAGGSAAYMAAPVVAGAATLALPATIAPAVATGIGMGLTGLVSGAQFTGSNLTRQMGEGSSLADTELGSAALAAIPQAALDVLSLKMIPGVRGIFGAAGKKMTAEEAEAIATQGLKRTVADYTLATGKTMGVEGLTEAGQQVFERLQAGLSLTDEKAQKEYLDSFLGGAALGGAMAPVGRYFERGREQREAEVVGAMPGQRPGESLADAAQRLKNEIDAEKLNLLPPPAPPPPPVSPILSEQDLNNLPYGQIPAYIGTLQALPQTPEIRAAIKAANTASLNDTEGVVNDFLLKKLDEASRSLQPQADGAGDLSFLPADLSTVISAQLANSIGFVQNKSKTNIFDQIVGKDISDPDQAAAVIDILNKYKAGVKPGATSQNIDTFIESIPFFKPVTPATQGTVNVGTTDTAPGGESTVLASEPGAGSTTPGVAATQPDGMVSTGQDVTSTVGGEAAAPPSIEEMSLVGPSTTAAERQPSMLKEREAFGKATGAVRGAGGWNLSGRVNQPAAKAVMLEDTPGVLSALSKSKNVFTQKIAELANLIPGLKTRINPEASEEEDLYRQNSEESTIVSHTMHINQLDAMRELKPIVEQLPSDQSYIPYKLLSKYVLLPKNTISDGNIEVNLNAGVRNINIKKSFLDTLEKLEAETKELGETRMRQSIGRVPYKRTAVAGSFDRSTNTVEIQSPYFAKDENILTHEYTHAITSYAIDNPTEEQKPIVRKLQKLFEHVKENLGKVREEVNPLHNKQYANADKPYGLTNIHEFVSEAWGNPDFQYWLSKVPYEKTTAWSKFVETIAQLLGIKDSNALTEAIALSEELVTAAKTGTEAQEKEYFSKRKPKEAAKPPAELSEVEKQDLAAIEAFKAEGPARIAEKTEQFKNILSKMLTRMGLKDVAVKIMDDIESKKYEGSYSAKLIKIALDADKPVRTLRHEAIHALKELGFFSESQWKALTKQANDGWINTYLKTRNEDGNPLKEGEKSRYDAYMERPEFKSDPNAIIEEAIADAFGDFDTNGAPPGMLKAILNRLISFFDAIKSALQGNGIYTSEQAARQIFGKITRGELKAPSREGPTTSGAQSSVQSGAQQGEASEQARSGEPALRPGDRGGEGSDGRDEEKLSVRGGRSEPTGDGGGRDKSGNDTPLAGAPTVQGGGPNPELVAVAEKYAKKYGIPYKKQSEYVELNVDRAKRLANAYEAMPNNPQDPKVKEAYADMIRQVRDQFDALSDSGYKFTFFDGETDPYDGNAWNAMRDLRATKTMAVYGTYDAYGPDGRTESAIKNNPMLADTGLLWKDQKGIERMVTANDLFRAVHDAFGHGLEGAGFRAQGEENAWQAHAKLFYGPALKALTSETRGQNSWVNYGSKGEKNRTAKVFDTDFADQKIGLMPDWTWKEGISKDEPVFQELDSRKDAKMFRNAVDRVKRGREYAFPLHVHDLETYQDARLFLSEDKESGFALIGDEIGSFFSGGGGQAYPTLRLAVEEGGRRIDAYRTKLPSVLGKANFRPVARVEFNPEMATELWDFEKFKQFQNGNPDLVFYAYDPSFNPKGDLKAGDEAVAQTPLVEYEQAVELQVAAAKYSLRGITLGTKQPDSVASSGVHYGKAKTDTLDALKYGTGLRGAESRRLETHWDNRIKKRVYFYIAKPDGTMPLPESGLGGYVYTQTFDNLAPPSVVSRLYSEARGDANTMESLIVDAGYDGYAVPKMGMMVILNHNTPVEYQGTKAEYESKKQEKLSLRSIPLSTRGIMEANDAFARSELGLKTKAVRNRFNKVRDIAIALNRETLENQGQMNRKELTTDDLNTISRALADEVSYQLLSSSKTGTGLGWYSNNYPKAVKKLAKRFPELETNQHARAVFSALVAVTSNGEKVTKNISNAITLYAKLRDGKPLVAMRNRRATALINNLKQIEMLLAKYDTDFEKELKKEVTVADMNAYLRSVGKKADASYLANTRIPAAAIYFGPKLGAFYANLSGSEGYLTMDLWWTRTFNRMRGLLIPHATDASIDKFREMIGKPNATRDDILAEAVPLRDKYKQYSFNTELEHLVGKKEPDTKAEKIDWVKRARVVAEDAFDQLMYDNRLEKMANTIYKNEYEMLQEAPFSSSDRKFMYDAARRTQKLLQEEKINLSLADIQAALWYYEKRLYGKLSGKKADDIGYEEAIIKQSSEGRGRTRLSVVFDRGVDTGNVSGGKSGTPDEVGGVPSGSTEKLSLRVPGYLYHRSNLEKLASVENGDKFVLQPGPQGAEGEGVYFSQDEVVRETTAEGTTRKPQTAVVVIKTPLRDGWYVSKTGKTIKYGKPRTWHTENKTIDLQAVDVKTIDGEKIIFAKPISSWVNAQEKLSLRAPDPDIRYSLRDKLGLYSELENKIEAVGPNQAPAPQWKAMIKGMVQKGVKPEEIEWSGVNDYLDLQEGKVSKAALLEYLKEGGVKVEETTLGDSQFTQAMSKRLDELEENNDRTDEEDLERQKLIRLENSTANVTTKYNYGQLILPGSTNYREVLLTLPSIATPERQLKINAIKKTAGIKYRSSHWDQLNVLAHIRINDRVDADNKKVLFVEEVQSDWGQQGKKAGFGDSTIKPVSRNDFFAYVDKLLEDYTAQLEQSSEGAARLADPEPFPPMAQMAQELGRADEYARMRAGRTMDREGRTVIPVAPFVTKTEGWLNLALKRIMVIAAEGSYDKVAFITGEQSHERFPRKNDRSSTRGSFSAFYGEADGSVVDDKGDQKFDKNGKPAVPIVQTALKELFRKIGVDSFNKVNIGLYDSADARELLAKKFGIEYSTQPGFDVTPEMKQKVETTGLPKFSLRSTWRASANAAIDRTSVARIEEGWASRILNAISPKHFSEYRQVWLNRYNQLGVYDKQRADRMGGFGLLADASSEAAAMMSDYGAGLTAAVFSKAGGVPVFANGMTTISTLNGTVKGPLEIFSVLTKLGKGDPDIYRAYQLWAGVKRGKRFMPSTTNPNGTEVNYTPADIAEAKLFCALNQGDPPGLYPEFAGVQKEWIKYNNQLSKYLVDTGVISAAGRQEWIKYGDYIPFYRQVDDEQTVGPKLFQSLTGVKPPKKLKGGTDLPIADFLETIIRNTQSAIQMGIKNTAGQKAVTVALSLNAPGSTDVLEPLSFVSTGDDTITILVNGMKKSFRSQDRLWLQAVTSLNLPDVPFMGLFSKPAQLLRTLVTKEPGFMLANMIRDSMSSHVTSGIGSVNPATTIRNFAAAIAGKSPEFQALFNAGILGGHEYSKDIIQSGNKFASDLRKTSGFRTANEKLASPITGIWEALEKGTTASDAATRMQVYREVLAKTNNEAEAIYRAVEVMNFNRKGNSAIVRVLTAAIPFLNARMQGLDVFYRAAFGKGINQQSADAIQKQFFIRGATMMAMSCMYWALTHDDDEYKKQEQETKDNYWLLPSLGIKLPIPFEVGILFKVIPERIMALTFGTDTNKDFTESMVRQLSNTLSLNPIPQVAKPFIEYNTNYNFFTGRPIVGSGMEGVESGYQTGPNTSGIAADIGKATGMSPLKLDHLVGGFTGTMGMYAFSLMDSIYKINGDSTDASKRFEQSPVIKRFLIDPEARGTVSAYYEIKNSTDAAVRTAGLLERTMNYKEWGPYYKDNIKLLATHDYMLSLEKSMKDFREMKLMIRSSKLSPDEKRDALLNITKAENKLTSNIQVIKKNID